MNNVILYALIGFVVVFIAMFFGMREEIQHNRVHDVQDDVVISGICFLIGVAWPIFLIIGIFYFMLKLAHKLAVRSLPERKYK